MKKEGQIEGRERELMEENLPLGYSTMGWVTERGRRGEDGGASSSRF